MSAIKTNISESFRFSATKNVCLRTVSIKDAAFVAELRSDTGKTKYLSEVDSSVKAQAEWIKNYKKREQEGVELYFVICSQTLEKLGLVRMYDYKGDSFCWGSWLVKPGAPVTTGLESALNIYELAFFHFGFNQCHFDVRIENRKVIKFHEGFGSEMVDSDELNQYYIFKKETYLETRKKYSKFISGHIE